MAQDKVTLTIKRVQATPEQIEAFNKAPFGSSQYLFEDGVKVKVEDVVYIAHEVNGNLKGGGQAVIQLKDFPIEDRVIYIRSMTKVKHDFKGENVTIAGTLNAVVRQFSGTKTGEYVVNFIKLLKGKELTARVTYYKDYNRNGDLIEIAANGWDLPADFDVDKAIKGLK